MIKKFNFKYWCGSCGEGINDDTRHIGHKTYKIGEYAKEITKNSIEGCPYDRFSGTYSCDECRYTIPFGSSWHSSKDGYDLCEKCRLQSERTDLEHFTGMSFRIYDLIDNITTKLLEKEGNKNIVFGVGNIERLMKFFDLAAGKIKEIPLKDLNNKTMIFTKTVNISKEFKEFFPIYENFSVEQANKKIDELTKGELTKAFDALEDANICIVSQFDGKWKKEIKKKIDNVEFNNGASLVTMLRDKNEIHYIDDDEHDFAGLAIPMKEGKTIVYIMPKKESLKEFAPKLSSAMHEMRFKSKCHSIYYQIPKTKIEYDIEIKDILREAGLEFGNLSKMTSDRVILGPIYHKAKIEIDEKGAKATGFTNAVVFKCMDYHEVEVEMNHDHFIVTVDERNEPSFVATFTGETKK